ncbi:MAG TPA: alpha/beta hydrolase domain-containing protein, partial [Bryobacteraceae bacterium]|nr:alpha/beta hydrolase domain-containing protein [Bryobacteraceae bacterium]
VYQRPATLDTTKATLTRQTSEYGQTVPIPSTDWAFADCATVPFPGTPDPSKICAKAGFDPAYLYQLVFTAKDPLVLGIGYAATRDLNSFLRYADKDDDGNPNPVAKKISWVISQGNSQSGNFIRSFIHLGFNQDEAGRIVWDGANPHIAGRQLALNFRFAVGGGIANPYEPGSDAVLWWNDYPDKARHHPTAGMLDRCRATNTCPKIFETFGTLEFWELRMSPNLVGTDAKADIPIPDNVRRYYFPGTTHGGGRGGFSTAAPAPPNGCVLGANPNPESDTTRALMVDLTEWVTKGVAPPASRYPRLDHGDLVKANATGFPSIPGVKSPEPLVNAFVDYDFGPDFNYNDLSGVITKEPPAIKQTLPTLVPRVNKDGNDEVGVPSVLLQAPLGTYSGWNVTAAGFNKGQICGLNGGFIPFAKTRAERMASGDPRPSLEERYASHDAYVARVKAAADNAVKERFLLPADADRLVAQAAASDVLVGEK